MTDFRFLVPVLCASAISMAPATAVAAGSSAEDHWQFKAGMYLWAAGVGLSRVLLGVHFPGDILAGALMGSGIALFTAAQLGIG